MEMLEYLFFPLVFVFVWYTIFLWHEVCHIMATGILRGTIYVDGLGLSCIPSFPDRYNVVKLCGGLGASLVSFLLMFMSTMVIWQFSFFTLGWVQLVYGCYEGFVKVNVRSIRYGLYVLVVLFCLVFWLVK